MVPWTAAALRAANDRFHSPLLGTRSKLNSTCSDGNDRPAGNRKTRHWAVDRVGRREDGTSAASAARLMERQQLPALMESQRQSGEQQAVNESNKRLQQLLGQTEAPLRLPREAPDLNTLKTLSASFISVHANLCVGMGLVLQQRVTIQRNGAWLMALSAEIKNSKGDR